MTDPVKVFGTYLSAGGTRTPLTGSVTFTPDVAAPDDTPGTAMKSQQQVVARLDKDGYFEVMLTASDDDGWRTDGSIPYRVDERIPGLDRQRLVFILAPGPVDLNTQPDVPLDYTGPVEVPVPGVPGPAGPANSLAIGTVTTVTPGGAATASITGTPPAQTLNLGIPTGATGATGAAGSAGAPGTPGAPGAPGSIGPAGAAATVQAGTTTTTAPGTNASVVNSGTSSAAVLDFQIPRGAVGATGSAGSVGPAGQTGPAGPPGTAATVTAGQTTTGAPGTQANVQNIGSTSNAILNFTIPQGNVGPVGPGSTVPGPEGPVGPVGPQGSPGELTKPVADNLYESKSDLLKEAAWWVDAGAVNAAKTQLDDLTGRGRPAVFGAGAAAPLSLPWSGEDYVYNPGATNYVAAPLTIPLAAVVTARFMRIDTASTSYLVNPTVTGVDGKVGIDITTNQLRVVVRDAANAGYTVTHPTILNNTNWHDVTITLSGTGATIVLDGVSHTATWTGGYVRVATPASNTHFPGYNIAVKYLSLDGTHILDPRNVSADYATITNTGSAGGNWTITRAATGFKTAVVDRPLLLFGGGQNTLVNPIPTTWGENGSTALVAVRRFGTVAATQYVLDSGSSGALSMGQQLVMDTVAVGYRQKNGVATSTLARSAGSISPSGQAVYAGRTGVDNRLFLDGVAGTSQALIAKPWGTLGKLGLGSSSLAAAGFEGELVAAAIFDRALTDAEIAEVSQDLAGVPHDKQPDPHPQYVLESTVGNLLTENQASGTDISPSGVSGCTVSGGKATSTGTAVFNAYITQPNVVAGQTYTLTAKAVALGRGAYVVAQFRDAAAVATGTFYGNTVGANQTGVSRVIATAPAGTTQARLYWAYAASVGVIGDSVTVTDFGFWRGAGGDWAMPGTPITGLQSSMELVTLWADLPASGNWLGRRIQVTSGLGFCVALWDSTKWVVSADSDTGWRTVTLINGWAMAGGGVSRLRRQGGRVTFDLGYRMDGSVATSDVFYALPLGWRRGLASLQSYGVVRSGTSGTVFTPQFVASDAGAASNMLINTRTIVNEGMLTWPADDAWPTVAP